MEEGRSAAPEQASGAVQRPTEDVAASGKPEGKKRKRGSHQKRKDKAKASNGDAAARNPNERGETGDNPAATEEHREDTELILSQETGGQQTQVLSTERSCHDEDTARAGNSEATKEQILSEEHVRSPEAAGMLRCPPLPLSDILTTLKSRQDTKHQEQQADDNRALKFCVVASVLALVCLYYAGFLAAYLLLAAQPEHRPSPATHDLPRTQWMFQPRTTSHRQDASTATPASST